MTPASQTSRTELLPDVTGFDHVRLGDLPTRAAARWGERTALLYGDARWTYTEFADDVDKLAKGLMAIGVQNGDHVAVWMTNRPEWLQLLYAVAKVGGCLVPLNTRYRSDDLAFTVINSEARLLIAIDRSGPVDYAALLTAARDEIDAAGHLDRVVMLSVTSDKASTLDRATSWDLLLAAGAQISDGELAERARAVDPDQLMMLVYTSGTTGHPKGVMHTHRPLRNVRERAMLLGHTRNDIHLNYLPLFHIYALSEIALMAMLTGGCQKLYDAFDAELVLNDIETLHATTVHGFDAVWADLLEAQRVRPRDVSSLRLGTLPAGAPSTTPIARQVQDVFCTTISGFGMSESWSFIVCSHPTDSLEQRTETSGYPMMGVEIEVRDPESGAQVPPGTEGKLFVRHFTVTGGYWANPAATAEAIDPNGWLDTGDIALLRPDGHLVFLGRHKDMLKVGGENMSPAEVEGYLREVPGVLDVAVVGFPDQRLSEVPVAYVTRIKESDPNATVTEDALLDRLRGRIASYKIPRAIIFLDEMPMTPSGKIRKVELRERALRDLAP